MYITAYIVGGVWLRFSNGVEIKIPKQLLMALHKRGIKIHYKFRKE